MSRNNDALRSRTRPGLGGLVAALMLFVGATVAISASSPLGQPDTPPRAAPKPSAPAAIPRRTAPSQVPRVSVPRTRVVPRVTPPKPAPAKPRVKPKPAATAPKPKPAVVKPPATATAPVQTAPTVSVARTSAAIPSKNAGNRATAILIGALLLIAALAAVVAALPFTVDRAREGMLVTLSRFWPESSAFSAATGILAVLVWLQA